MLIGFLLLYEFIDRANIYTMKFLEIEFDSSLGSHASEMINAMFIRNYAMSYIVILLFIHRRTALMISYLKNSPSTISIKQILCIHDRLCDVINSANKCFSVNSLFTFYNYALISILVAFTFCGLFLSRSVGSDDVVFLLVGVNVLLLHALVSFAIIHFSNVISRSAAKVMNVIHTSNCTSSDYLKWSSLASLQLSHQTLNISTGFYIVNWTFLFAIFASILSNVVIMLQFLFSNVLDEII